MQERVFFSCLDSFGVGNHLLYIHMAYISEGLGVSLSSSFQQVMNQMHLQFFRLSMIFKASKVRGIFLPLLSQCYYIIVILKIGVNVQE
jgi:hypothetical protein